MGQRTENKGIKNLSIDGRSLKTFLLSHFKNCSGFTYNYKVEGLRIILEIN